MVKKTEVRNVRGTSRIKGGHTQGSKSSGEGKLIAGIEGTIQHIDADSVVIKVNGMSFKANCPSSTISRLRGIGSKVELYTHLIVRDDNLSLYGFASSEEVALFTDLISVGGIGPKVALSMLSTMSAENLAAAIASGDIGLLTRMPGLGKKTADRLVLELKTKMKRNWSTVGRPISVKDSTDVLEVLTNLGYSINEATAALGSLPDAETLSLEDKIRMALQYLGERG
ncbi:MAG: Holliday junction branch migration protein RuvA [Chloroflexota bacterium]|nr:Holliday junction branch migration protein RuvA [Chloroflexota bacterium]